MIHEFGLALEGYDGLITPTVPIVAPELSAFAADEEYVRLNQLLLRNPSLFNFLDGCAISLPVHPAGTAPVGLMLAAPAGRDVSLLGTALGLEAVFSGIDNVEVIA
jgi:aspartyl-tRNA(Asn)/glutamyl-tRNA(Gln) amidotransferase subunit A